MWKREYTEKRLSRYHSDEDFRKKHLSYKIKRLSTPEGRVKENLNQRKSAAKKKGIVFDLVFEDLLPLPTHCPIFGIELDYTGNNIKNSPSIDRIIPEKGYVKGNVMIISNRANTLKRDASIEEVHLLSDFYRKKFLC